jgi:hypothetical protein
VRIAADGGERLDFPSVREIVMGEHYATVPRSHVGAVTVPLNVSYAIAAANSWCLALNHYR